MQQDPNYGRPEEPDKEPSGSPVGGPIGNTGRSMGTVSGTSQMNTQDERTWSMLSHLSVLAVLIGLLPWAALIIWLVYKDKSPRVGFHALQSLWYQIAWIAIFVVYFFVTFILSIITFGLAAIVLVPLGFLLMLVPLIHQCYAAYKVNQGFDYRYPFIADWIDSGRRFA